MTIYDESSKEKRTNKEIVVKSALLKIKRMVDDCITENQKEILSYLSYGGLLDIKINTDITKRPVVEIKYIKPKDYYKPSKPFREKINDLPLHSTSINQNIIDRVRKLGAKEVMYRTGFGENMIMSWIDGLYQPSEKQYEILKKKLFTD